jgi:hypothetical protein
MELTAQGRDIIHHLAMVATGKCFLRFAPTAGSHRGHAVDVFDRRRLQIIHHLAMVATGLWWMSSIDVDAKSSTIWRWWLRDYGGCLRSTPLPNHPPSGDGGYGKMFLTIRNNAR